ncbi:hypothetical protein CC86DRAFT_351641 [Ophiobolus disseminans]|uniref:Uncharacterized protein n=1 Tax=Ophiobolus disseminans TaxID=1469910 RepID=A0A6A6ZZ37_9PLEO|nr:hypothetical protein CC86DRAFT_351641 [Ophiobolus disseminans]
MTPPRSAAEYRQAILKFGSRSYTRSILHGYIYRFLVELLRDNDADLARKFPNLDHYEIAHVTKYDATTPSPPSYVRGHAYLSNSQFLIEQEISITIQAEETVLWSDVGNRPLSQSLDFHRFIAHLTACSKTGFSSIRFIPPSLVGRDSDVCDDALPFLPSLHPTSNDPSLIQSATHLPHEHHLLVDPTIAALDPMYALTPIFAFAAATENEILGTVSKRYELISSTRWDPKHSVDYMEQLILHKHLLDEHAFRHEEVLRFLAQEDFVRFESNLSPEHAVIARKAKQSLKEDFEFLLHRCNILSTRHDGAMNNLVGLTALGEARKQIRLATQVTKLTVLATVFLPLSFCTSIFGMNFVELVGLRVWVWGLVTVLVGGVTVVGYAWDERGVWVEGVRRLWARRGGGSEGA